MKNPWTKKNPFMSMWLSGANAVAGTVRGQAGAAAKAQTARAVKQGVSGWLGFLTQAIQPGKAAASERPAAPAVPAARKPGAVPARKPTRKTAATSRPRRRKAR
jgi:hypothetical protein